MKILNKEFVLRHTPKGVVKKVMLKNTKHKGVGIFAKKAIRKNEVIAYYKIFIYQDGNGFKSETKNMYTIGVATKSGIRESSTLIGDLAEDSLETPRRGIPFWGYFANEPSGHQTPNCYIDPNVKENYKSRSRVSAGDTMIYKVRADRAINPGEEIVWCYGPNYIRHYTTKVC